MLKYLSIFLFLFLIGCGGGGTNYPQPEEDDEEIAELLEIVETLGELYKKNCPECIVKDDE